VFLRLKVNESDSVKTMATIKTTSLFFLCFISNVFLQVAIVSGDGSMSSDGLGDPDPTLSSHSLGLNNVGLNENDPLDDVTEPTLQGPNVCTKQET
jgi:hypothetical protein